MANKFTIEDFIQRINMFFPNWNYKILEFNGYKQPTKILCKNCGQILSFKKAADISRKINICACYKQFKNYHDKINYLGQINHFKIIEDLPNTSIKTIQCTKCGLVMKRSVVSLLNTPSHCDNCDKYREGKFHYSVEEIQNKLDKEFYNEYELIQFNGMNKEALLRHRNCGFIFKIRELHDLFVGRNRGCPKCYQFKSKGEQAIQHFLEEHKIIYIPQKTFAPLNKSKYRFDFYIPDFNLAIEYQGEQHFKQNKMFNDTLEHIQQRDNIKRQYCKENRIELLEIPYTKLNDISHILTSRFNDYLSESR